MRFISLLSMFFALFCGVMLAVSASAQQADDGAKQLPGLWITANQAAIVEFYSCDTHMCGRFAWLKAEEEGGLTRDEHNHDATKRDHPLCHMQFISGFTEDAPGHFKGGSIYNPKDGNTYNAEMTLIDNDTLKVGGYFLLPVLGQSQTWKRVKAHEPCVGDRS